MSQNFVVESIDFRMKTQAMLNFAPMIFTIKQPRRRDNKLQETQLLGSNFITTVDQDGNLHEIKIVQFLKEYSRIQQAFEVDSQIITDTFNVLQEGMVRATFPAIMTLAYNKYAMNAKMRSRSGI
jgi:hypothetical protein